MPRLLKHSIALRPTRETWEGLARYGTLEQKERWSKPLLAGEIRSDMTEPAVASSDATNIQASIVREGGEYVLNGRKWWTSGAMALQARNFHGQDGRLGPRHISSSRWCWCPCPGVIERLLTVFGYDHAPHGHGEVVFKNVRVPVSNMLLGEGRGFEIAQGRRSGRIHHCMRCIGWRSERSKVIMCERVQSRVAFGKPLAAGSCAPRSLPAAWKSSRPVF